MKRALQGRLTVAIAGLLLCVNVPTWAQSPSVAALEGDRTTFPRLAGWYAGAEFLLIRPHWSEAIAFAQGTQTASSFQTAARELQFDYDPSLRAFAGYRFGNGRGELRFTYSHLPGDIDVSADGSALGAGEFIVDPLGNLVGTVVVIDPSDRRFGTPDAILTGGDFIRTRATVETNVYDVDFVKPVLLKSPNWAVSWSAGARIADVDQYYESVITNAGAPFARGEFSVDFIGAGPRLGFEARRYLGQACRLSVFANGHGALLVGDYDVRFSNATTVPVPFVARQESSLTRTVPVMETELGASWCVSDSLSLTLGWLFQAWLDLGTSGGQFGGFFAGADDTNVMSFDGLSLAAEWTF